MVKLHSILFQKGAAEAEKEASDLTGSLRRLKKWEENLHRREQEYYRKREKLEQEKLQLAKRAKELEERELRLNMQEDQLDSQEHRLVQQKTAMEDAVMRYAHERALWQQQKFHPAQESLDGHMDQIRGHFEQIRDDFVRLSDQVQQIQNKGIEELCWLYREISANPDEKFQPVAARVAFLLRQFFGAEPIEPVPGQRFDSTLCEAVSGTGDTVSSCQHRGWKWNGGIFRAAVTLNEN